MSDHAISNAKGWIDGIVKTIAALKELEENDGEIECGQCEGTGTIKGGLGGDGEDEECPVCDGSGMIEAPEGEDADSIRERIQEGPLAITVRNGWHHPGGEADSEPEEYAILLSTGGPALRIYGALGEWNEPDDYPHLQWQDWGTPWTDYPLDSDQIDALAEYARQFWFGE